MSQSSMRANEPSKGEISRQKLLDAAAECFRREGFHGTSIARIARAAGMSPGHIYNLFANKEAIVEAIAEREEHDVAKLQQELEQQRGADSGSLATILARHIGKVIRRSTDPDHANLALELAAEATRNPAVRSSLQRTDLELAAGFRRQVQHIGLPKGFDEGELQLRMQVIVALIEGLRLRLLLNPDLDLGDVERIAGELIEVLFDDRR